ncbi:hypothetical protein ACERII_05500 [Evansella sp. AB-rgal1]|uniref:hypothetical protein n=1 Tax=Evansella sp. AB-rgal1 TaxID=3242696 RepID=UPI00359EB76B
MVGGNHWGRFDPSKLEIQLPTSKVSNLKGKEFIIWSQMKDVLASFESKTPHEYEKYVAGRARRWLEGKLDLKINISHPM